MCNFYNRATLVIIFLVATVCLSGCSNSSWGDAKQANTYKAYQRYIEAHPKGKKVILAKKRADSLYWQAVQHDTTAQSFQKYLRSFPEGNFRAQAHQKINQIARNGLAARGRVTGSGVIIRSDHTTESASKGVVAKKGTTVQILDQYGSGNGDEAILKNNVTVTANGQKIHLSKGKAIRIVADYDDSVEAAFTSSQFGKTKTRLSKSNIEAIGGQKWYKIHTTDGITGWIYGKFVEQL